MIVYDMTPRWIVVGLLALSPALVTPAVLAQQSPAPAPKQAPPPEDLEPGVNTSSMPASSGSSGVSSSPNAATPAAGATSASAPKDSKSTSDSGSGAKSSKAAPHAANPTNPPAAAAPTNSGGKGGKAEDHLQLDTTQITGNQELPKVLYIVPWKKSDLGDLLGKPANSLLDEVLQPVDRDVFKRENRYYDALKPDGATGASGKGVGAGASSGSGDKP
jgi:hypothetical protein